MKKYLYLPMEIVVREQDGKSTFAYTAAQAGWTVLIAPKLALYDMATELPEGIFLVKSIVPAELGQIRMLKASGHKVCSLDEEGVVTFKQFLKGEVRYNEKTITEVDHIFFWGEAQADAFLEAYPNYAHKGTVTGSPRFEFWRDYAENVYKRQIEEIRSKYKDFILIPTSFGIANNVLGEKSGVELTKIHSGALTKDMVNFMVGQGEQNLIAYKEYLDFLPEILYKFRDTNFVIRPHPSESHETWKDLVGKHRNLHFCYEGSVTPWILASLAIFHFKSTTSIEAYIMGRPAVTYLMPHPPYMEKFLLPQPLAASFVAKSREETIKIISDIIEQKPFYKPDGKIKGILQEWISVDEQSSAADRILEKMEKISPQATRSLHPPRETIKKKIRMATLKILNIFNRIRFFNTITAGKYDRLLNGISYGLRKYKGLSREHIENIFCVIDNINHRKEKTLELNSLAENIFVVQKIQKTHGYE